MLQPRGHRRDRQAAQGSGRDRRAPGQPLSGWGNYQAVGRLSRTHAALRTSCGVRKHRRTTGRGLTIPISTWTKTSVLVLKGIGPKGFPGMPEAGKFGLPKKLLQQGVRDMICISDGRMSGTAYGTVILHVRARSRGGRPAGLGAGRRPDRSWTWRSGR